MIMFLTNVLLWCDLYETKNGQKGTIINNTINRLILAALKYKERHYNENDEAFRCYVYCG